MPEQKLAAQEYAAKKAAWYMDEERPVTDELRTIGVDVPQVTALRVIAPEITEILLRHLFLGDYSDATRANLAAVLSMAKPRAHWDEFVALYKRQNGPGEAEQLADLLATIARTPNFEELQELVLDPANGDSRVMLLGALVKTGGLRARPALESAAREPKLMPEATVQLRRLDRAAKKRPTR